MPYVIAVAAAAILTLAVRSVMQAQRGHRLTASLLTGAFDDSPIGQTYAAWFSERPSRIEQRNLFVNFAIGIGCQQGGVASAVQRAIVADLAGDSKFGNELAAYLDTRVVYDQPLTPEQAELQAASIAGFQALKAHLRSLD